MKNIFVHIALICAALLVFNVSTAAQSKSFDGKKSSSRSTEAKKNGAITQVANFAGQVTVVIVKSAAKTARVTTKFAAKDVAKPILFKLLPAVTKYSLKFSGFAVKRLLPHAAKLALL